MLFALHRCVLYELPDCGLHIPRLLDGVKLPEKVRVFYLEASFTSPFQTTLWLLDYHFLYSLYRQFLV